ncbi:hypothetical protein IQ62_25935 [Streptomyces scabiei]|nr:hypothetical protein IQ62_25935 [Streptomyces scabiei]
MVLLGAVLTLLLGGAGTASAHAVLTNADPADAAVVKTAPKQVTLTFTEAVSLSDGSVRVLSPENQRVNQPADHVGGKANTIRAKLRGELATGTYTVAWRVVSADSHPISGAFTFSVGKPSATSAVAPSDVADGTAVSRIYGILRYVAYTGLALLVGVAVFVLVCWPVGAALRRVRRLLVFGWAALLGTTLALLLRGPYETGSGLTAVFDPSMVSSTLTGRTGLALGARLLLLAVAGVLLRLAATRFGRAPDDGREERGGVVPRLGIPGRALGLLLAVGLAATWAAAEHASAGLQVPLAIPVAALHLLAMAVWLGGLLALAVVLFRAPPDAVIPAPAVARFSRLAFTAVAVLVVTGVYQSWRQVGSWEAVSSTQYGRILALKVGTVLLVLVAAAFSRNWTARLIHPPQATPETESLTVLERVPAAQTVGAGTAPSGSGPEDGRSVEPPSPRDPSGSPDPLGPESGLYRRGLRRSVAAEAALGVVVLAVTTVLTGTQPSRAAVAGAATAAAASQLPPATVVMVPFDVGTPNGNGKVQISLEPGQVGENIVEALVFAWDGGVATVPELRLTFTQRARKIGPLDAKLANQGGYWATDSLQLPMAGTWTMKLTVRITDVDQVTVSKDVKIRELPTRTTAP